MPLAPQLPYLDHAMSVSFTRGIVRKASSIISVYGFLETSIVNHEGSLNFNFRIKTILKLLITYSARKKMLRDRML